MWFPSLTQHHSFFRNLPPSIIYWIHCQKLNCKERCYLSCLKHGTKKTVCVPHVELNAGLFDCLLKCFTNEIHSGLMLFVWSIASHTLFIAELTEHSPIIIQNSSNTSSRKNLDVQPYDWPYKVLLLACLANCATGTIL